MELKNLKYEDVHLIGHSLGAHTVSFVSISVGEKKIGRITGNTLRAIFVDSFECKEHF